jgi:uncharacterized membrane protein
MELIDYLTLYVIAVVVFFAIDMLWLGVIAKDIYQKYLGKLMAKEINWPVAILFYLVFITGLVYFAIAPAVGDSWTFAAALGGAFGFFTYATYDLTNYATLKNWPREIVVIDMIWGTVLGAAVATITHLVYAQFVG